MEDKPHWMSPENIRTERPFECLFPIAEKTINAVAEDMKANGYDVTQPITLWDKDDLVIDGHTRLLAARRGGLRRVCVTKMAFSDESEALEYAIRNHWAQRNRSDAEIFRIIEIVDKRKAKGGDRKSDAFKASKASNDATGKSSEATARAVGTSPRKVEKARTILDHANEEIRQAVLMGEKTIHGAYQEIRRKRERRAESTIRLSSEPTVEDGDLIEEFQSAYENLRHVIRMMKGQNWKIVPRKTVVRSLYNLLLESRRRARV